MILTCKPGYKVEGRTVESLRQDWDEFQHVESWNSKSHLSQLQKSKRNKHNAKYNGDLVQKEKHKGRRKWT